MAESKSKRTVRRLYEEVLNDGRLEVLDEIALPTVREHNPLPGQTDGVEGLKQHVSMVRGAFDPKFTIEHLLEDGDKVAVMWTNHGTHLAEWFGIPSTGNSFAINGIDIFRLEGGRLAEHWDVVDVFGMLSQIGVLPAPGSDHQTAIPATEANKAQARRMVDEVVNDGNIDLIDELLGPDFVDHSTPPGVPPTREGAKALMAALRQAFPDLHATVDDVIAEGDRVVQRTTAQGTMRGELMGMPASGRSATWEQIHIIRFADGKEVEHWAVNDQLGMLVQLGLAEPPNGARAAGALDRPSELPA